MPGEAHAEAVRLHALVAVAGLEVRVVGLHTGEEPARRVAGLHVGIDSLVELVELRLSRLVAVQRLAIDGVRLAPHVVRNPGRRHEVALVCGVDERLSAVGLAGERGDGDDAPVPLLDALLAVEPLVAADVKSVALLPALQDGKRHGRLERPLRLALEYAGRRGLAPFLVRELNHEMVGIPVVLRHVLVEIKGEAAKRGLVADVRLPESACRESSDPRLGRDYHRAPPHALRLDRRRQRGGRAAVDHDVAVDQDGA